MAARKKVVKVASAGPVACSTCEAVGKTAKLPVGWKRLEQVFCGACWKKKYILRAITFPVSGPRNISWPELRPILKSCFAESTSLANWSVLELSKNDVSRLPGQEKMPPMPAINLYRLFNGMEKGKKGYPGRGHWAGAANSANSILRAVQTKYLKERLSVVWRNEQALPRFKYPYPYPIIAKGWRPYFVTTKSKDGTETYEAPMIDVAMPGQRVQLELRTGKEFRRQLAAFRQMVSGDAPYCQMLLYEQKVSDSAHRTGSTVKAPGGGQKAFTRLMVKLVAWIPRPPAREAAYTMLLSTDPNAFWVAESDGHRTNIFNADHVVRWVKSHRIFLQRIGEDRKREKRWSTKVRRSINEHVEKRCRKHDNRIKTWIHQVATSIVSFATKCRVSHVIYDDTCKSYLEFPWFQLKAELANKLDAHGIVLVTKEAPEQDLQLPEKSVG